MAIISLILIGHNGYAAMNTTDLTDEGYIIDQMQVDDGFYNDIIFDNPSAQSFIPTITPLAKVRLLIKQVEGSSAFSGSLKVSIRDSVDGEDITSVIVDEPLITDEYSWVNCDFDDITIQVEQPYFIVASSMDPSAVYHWAAYSSMDIDKYEAGSGWYQYTTNGIVRWAQFPDFIDFCFKTYSYAGKTADLSCQGIIGLPNQEPGGTVSEEITIENVGDSLSLLNWEVVSAPDWGEWTFDPSEGYDLTPEDGPMTIQVIVVAPEEEQQSFHGEIIIGNKDNPEDTESISVSLSTSKTKQDMKWWVSFIPDGLLSLLEQLPFFQFWMG